MTAILQTEAEAVINAVAPLLGLTIKPEQRASVSQNFEVAARLAVLVLGVDLEDEAEPAPVFRA